MDYTGKLLVATPALGDPNFSQTVVLLVQGSDEEGVLGLVLNRVSDKPIRELWKSVFSRDCKTDNLLHLGGPVFGPVFAVHSKSFATLPCFEIVPGVFFASTRETLEVLADETEVDFRFFVGNAGWEAGQLAREIDEGAWYLVEATRELVFADETEIWCRLIENVGRSILGEMLHTDKLPDDPSLN